MSLLTFVAVEMELKYCERCGALCLRLRGSPESYCGLCKKYVAQLGPVAHERRPQ